MGNARLREEMKRNMSISFDEEIWDKLRDMRNSSDFVNILVFKALEAGDTDTQVCEICGSNTKPLIWMMPMEKLVCSICEKKLVWEAQHSTTF